MELIKNTFYINLQERGDRKQHIEKELKKINITPQRINACKMKHDCVGCSMSHIRCIELAKLREYDEIFIVEDDSVFTKPKVLLESLKKFKENIQDWDVLIIGGNVIQPYEVISDYCLRSYNTQTTTAYIVKKHYYDTLIKNYKDGVKELMKDPTNKIHKNNYAIDMYWKSLQIKDKWYVLTPLTVTQLEDYSDIECLRVNYDHLMLDFKKEWLHKSMMDQYNQQQQQSMYNNNVKFSIR